MFLTKKLLMILFFFVENFKCISCSVVQINTLKTKIWGPGLEADKTTLPVRYFFIHPLDQNGNKINQSLPEKFDVRIFGNSVNGACRYRLDQINRADGSSIIRYKISETCKNAEIHIKYSGEHLGYSPFIIKSSIYPEACNCPQYTTNKWLLKSKCPLEDQQIKEDMIPFRVINFTNIRPKILEKYNNPGSVSLCNYVIKQNEIYRKCNGQYTGFKMFMDAILVSLVKIMRVPDMEFFINLGDFPLVKKGGQSRTTGPVPIFSWCGSDDSFDIVLPTYDITESTLENMGRVTLDMLSVQKLSRKWNEKISKGFWRGRDSRRERLDLIDLSRKFPDLLNASLTNFFFFRDEENKYGPKEAHISFFDFFDYKYQINIDGTVAAYRFPYLLAGNSVVFKQESIYYEHFYKKLIPNYHYIPFKKDLTNVVDKLVWAKLNDDKALQIMKNANKFVNENLLPLDIYCYHALLFKEFAQNIVSPIVIAKDMEKVAVHSESDKICDCKIEHDEWIKDEL